VERRTDTVLVGLLVVRGVEVDDLLTFRRHGDVAGGDVAEAVGDVRQQLVTRGRDDDHRDRALVLAVLPVDVRLEVADGIGRDAALGALVDEIERPTVGHEHPDQLALEHPVEVALPRLVCERQGAFGRGLGCVVGFALRCSCGRLLHDGRRLGRCRGRRRRTATRGCGFLAAGTGHDDERKDHCQVMSIRHGDSPCCRNSLAHLAARES